MKRTLQLFSLFAFIVVFIVSCSSGADSSNPNAVLKTFFELLSKKDLEGAAKLATKDSKSTLDMVKKGMDMAESMKDSLKAQDPAAEFKDVQFGEAKINGNTATIAVSSKSKNQPPADFTLVKEDGQWKVDFSMATLMKMGQQQINSGAPAHAADTANIKPEDLKRSMEMADSVLKNMDPKQMEEIKKSLEQMKEQKH